MCPIFFRTYWFVQKGYFQTVSVNNVSDSSFLHKMGLLSINVNMFKNLKRSIETINAEYSNLLFIFIQQLLHEINIQTTLVGHLSLCRKESYEKKEKFTKSS